MSLQLVKGKLVNGKERYNARPRKDFGDAEVVGGKRSLEVNGVFNSCRIGWSLYPCSSPFPVSIHSDSSLPASKKQHVVRNVSSILAYGCEVWSNVYSFLTLKDSLELRRTCHELHDSNLDAFRYSNLRYCGDGFCQVLANLSCAHKLHSVLHNESLCRGKVLTNFLQHTKTDDTEALCILLEYTKKWLSGNADWDDFLKEDVVSFDDYLSILRRGFGGIAKILGQFDNITEQITICATCSSGIGCYQCVKGVDCFNEDSNETENYLLYCRDCATAENHFCACCNDYLCSACYANRMINVTCKKCNAFACHDDDEGPIRCCYYCAREKCVSCIGMDSELWLKQEKSAMLTIPLNVGRPTFSVCPSCFPQHTDIMQSNVKKLSELMSQWNSSQQLPTALEFVLRHMFGRNYARGISDKDFPGLVRHFPML